MLHNLDSHQGLADALAPGDDILRDVLEIIALSLLLPLQNKSQLCAGAPQEVLRGAAASSEDSVYEGDPKGFITVKSQGIAWLWKEAGLA